MIEFRHRLPSLFADGKQNGTYNNEEMVLPCMLTTDDSRLGEFLHRLHNAIQDDRRLVFIDGRVLGCYKNWIRDHVHEMKAFKHWEHDLRSFLQFVLDTQTEEGYYFELVKQLDDGHWTFVDPPCYRIYAEDNLSLVRLELEADIEYLVVEGAMQYYRASGDAAWLRSVLPKLERGIEYITSSPKRWDAAHGLVKRPFTIDTWDFTAYAAVTDRRIHADEKMSVMHGDNSGVYRAMLDLAQIRERMGDGDKAAMWRSRAERLKENMFRYLWNGNFFIHQRHLGHAGLDEKEAERLSLSNTYDINRGVTDVRQSRKIIEEYLRRRKTGEAFAEWYSIDPPYEKFAGYSAGQYVNGALSPFTAGELAKAAFRNGYESYGWDIVSRFTEMLERDKDIYFLYSPKDSMPQGGGPSGWGAAALLSAVDEGLAGVEDADCLYREIDFSPRFVVTPYRELRYITGYESSGVYVDVRWIRTDEGMRYDVFSPAERINAHILLPAGKACREVRVNGAKTDFRTVRVADSAYADFSVPAAGRFSAELYWER